MCIRDRRLAGARLALDQQRPLERERGVDGELEVVGGDVGVGAFEAHGGGTSRGTVMVAEIDARPSPGGAGPIARPPPIRDPATSKLIRINGRAQASG